VRKYFATVYCILPLVGSLVLSAQIGIWLAGAGWLPALAIAMSVFLFGFSFVVLAAALSLPFQNKIRPVKCARNLSDPDYFPRAIYGRLWTSFFYFKPLYSLVLNLTSLRNLTFRAFGYRGSTLFTIFPDSWIRDLPLLHFGPGTYIANRSTLGTNICLKDNTTVVGEIHTGRSSLVGHMAVIALGTRIGDETEIGVSATVGIRTRVGSNTLISPRTAVNHGSVIGNSCVIGTNCYLGIRAKLSDNLNVPAATVIPDGKILRTQDDVDAMVLLQGRQLKQDFDFVNQLLVKFGSNDAH
jgi:carbonic anhydrase/acetyltransferase-like protein (isoleucine patch superfamily)